MSDSWLPTGYKVMTPAWKVSKTHTNTKSTIIGVKYDMNNTP